jgi:hypothetical protein
MAFSGERVPRLIRETEESDERGISKFRYKRIPD